MGKEKSYTVTQWLRVPLEAVGRLVGTGGSTIRRIEAAHDGVSIRVGHRDNAEDGTRTVTARAFSAASKEAARTACVAALIDCRRAVRGKLSLLGQRKKQKQKQKQQPFARHLQANHIVITAKGAKAVTKDEGAKAAANRNHGRRGGGGGGRGGRAINSNGNRNRANAAAVVGGQAAPPTVACEVAFPQMPAPAFAAAAAAPVPRVMQLHRRHRSQLPVRSGDDINDAIAQAVRHDSPDTTPYDDNVSDDDDDNDDADFGDEVDDATTLAANALQEAERALRAARRAFELTQRGQTKQQDLGNSKHGGRRQQRRRRRRTSAA